MDGRRSCGVHSPDFPLTRNDALARWRQFLPAIPRYAAMRNHVGERHDHVSRLSTAFRFGLISPEEIVRETLETHSFESAGKWVQEVCWRSYWRAWLRRRPQIWTDWRRRVRHLESTLPEEVLGRATAVAEGRSGVAVMDHFARELCETGYLHNHARMWWAAFWIHTERLPWELGAAFFFRHLLDADPASNTLSWRWVAGRQTAGKSYLVRRSNMEKYAAPELLADPRGLERIDDGAASAVDPGNEPVPEPLAPELLPAEPPEPSGKLGIWLHADDGLLEDSPLAPCRPVSVAAFPCPSAFTAYGLSPLRTTAIRTALGDALQRAGTHFQCQTALVEAAGTAAAVVSWAQQQQLQVVAAMAPAVGPVHDALPAVRSALAACGIALHLCARPWEQRLTAMATSGFFPFWNRASQWLREESATHP
jgi:deoxyribodipyrimidine photo-lyase